MNVARDLGRGWGEVGERAYCAYVETTWSACGNVCERENVCVGMRPLLVGVCVVYAGCRTAVRVCARWRSASVPVRVSPQVC